MVEVRATQDKEKKRRAVLDMMGYKRLQKVGSSFALVVPTLWLAANAAYIEGVPYVMVDMTLDALTLSNADVDDINAQLEANNA